MVKRIIITAALFGASAVVLGAFGAHGLKKIIDQDAIAIWTKAVEYQFYHTFALLFLSQLKAEDRKFTKWAYIFFTAGILLFSGSLYLLATRMCFNIDFEAYIGPVTPIGGLLMILGWLSLFMVALKRK